MPDVTGEQQISDSAWGGQQFLLAASRPIRIEYGTHLWDNIAYVVAFSQLIETFILKQ